MRKSMFDGMKVQLSSLAVRKFSSVFPAYAGSTLLALIQQCKPLSKHRLKKRGYICKTGRHYVVEFLDRTVILVIAPVSRTTIKLVTVYVYDC